MELIKIKSLDNILMQLDGIEEKMGDLSSPPHQVILSNKELSTKLNVTTRTLQNWRDKGLISYSKVSSEIFYKLSDVLIMLDNCRKEAYAR